MDDVDLPEPPKVDNNVLVLNCSIKMKTCRLRKPAVTPVKSELGKILPRYYRCNACKAKFLKEAELHQHFKDNHLPVLCNICKKEFSTQETLECHSYIHKDLKFKCNQCGQRFPFASSHDSHKLSHTSDKTQVCKICGKSYVNKGDLVKHEKVYFSKMWKCQLCAYENHDERNLKAHMRCHSNLKPYMCPKCLKLFCYQTQLAHHLPCKMTLEKNSSETKFKRSGSPEF